MSTTIKRGSDIAFQPLASFTSKRPRAGSASSGTQISFSTFTRGDSAEQASIATLAERPPLSSFHADITPDNKIEDPSVSPIIVSFPVQMDSRDCGVSKNGFIPKGVIITADYKHDKADIEGQVHTRGPFNGIVVRGYKATVQSGVTVSGTTTYKNDDVVAVVTAESCRGPDPATNNVCVISGAIADTTELNMEGCDTDFKPGDVVYARRSTAQSSTNTENFANNKNFTFFTGNNITEIKKSCLKFMIIHPQRGKSNAMVTIFPMHRFA